MKRVLLFIVLGLSIKLSAQVYTAGTTLPVYKDINPDSLLNYIYYPYTREIYRLDLFGDTAADVLFIAQGAVSSGGSSAFISILPADSNHVSILYGRTDTVPPSTGSYWYITNIAKPLNIGDTINAAGAIWDNGVLYLTDHSGSSSGVKDVNDFIGGDKYIGIKYQNGTTVYGWIKVGCISEDSCFVKSFSNSYSPSAIDQAKQASINIFPNPFVDEILVSYPITNENTTVTIIDMQGRIIRKEDLISTQRSVSMYGVDAGVYVLHIITNDRQMISTKIVKY